MVAGKGNSHVKEAADGYLGVPPFSTAPMARNTENPRCLKDGCWKQEHSPINSTIFVDLRVSTDFGVSNVKLGLGFLLPNSTYKICPLGRGWISGFPPFHSIGQKDGKSRLFQGWLPEIGAFAGKFDDFRRSVDLHQYRHLQWKIEAPFSVANFCLQNESFIFIRPRVDLGVLLLLGGGGGGGAIVIGVADIREREKESQIEREISRDPNVGPFTNITGGAGRVDDLKIAWMIPKSCRKKEREREA